MQVAPGLTGERWSAVDASFSLPGGWQRRSGARSKLSKTILYTDTYGPALRYTTLFPRFVDAEGALACDSVSLQVQGRSGSEAITDLGPQAGIDPARAFELTDTIADIASADVVSATTRKDKAGQSYYDWELRVGGNGHHVLLTAVVSGGGLYAFSIDASAEQWSRSSTQLRGMQASLSVAPSPETTADLSTRIYTTRK